MLRWLALPFLFLLFGCSTIKSGKYVQAIKGDSYETISKDFLVPVDVLKKFNDAMEIRPGVWVFIPKEMGLLALIKGVDWENSWVAGSDAQGSGTKLLWPVPRSSKISSYFGIRKARHHDGIDIPAPRGSSIVAADNGVIVYAGAGIRGYGNMTIINHQNGYFTIYAHARRNYAKKGQKVFRGQVIATVGSTGRSTGPHLHFEVRHFDRSLNPLNFLDVPSGKSGSGQLANRL